MSAFFNVFPLLNTAGAVVDALALTGPYRPPQWGLKQLTSIVGTIPGSGTGPTTYFFDAVLRLEHMEERRFTEHPIQTAASIVDHSYDTPSRLVMEIGMSDVNAIFKSGQFTSNPSKSVSAYQTLLQLKSLGIPLIVNTRLKQYLNMGIEFVRAIDDRTTANALRATVAFRQILVAQTATQTVSSSARSDQTGITMEGTKNPTAPGGDIGPVPFF